MNDNFEKLYELLEQHMLEFLFTNDICRLVYMMNDTAESFLLFENYVLTGYYDPEEEEIEDASLDKVDSGYLLIVKQGNQNTFSLRFTDLSFEVHLYNYGPVGHFWVEKYEYIRQIEYHIAILRDKYRYLGPEYCSEEEIRLSALDAFPPLLLYPSAPKKYWYRENPWYVDEEAIAVALELARESGDTSLEDQIQRYQNNPTKISARSIARALHQTEHQGFVQLLWQKLMTAAAIYPDRSFGREKDEIYAFAWEQAQKEIEIFFEQGYDGMILREEPFVFGNDGEDFKIHLLLWKDVDGDRVSLVKTYLVNAEM